MPKEALKAETCTEDICAMLQFTKEFEWKCLNIKKSLKFGKTVSRHKQQFLKRLYL